MPRGHTCEHGFHGCAFCRIEYESNRRIRAFLFKEIYSPRYKDKYVRSERYLITQSAYPGRSRK